jgi:hypothetical protein
MMTSFLPVVQLETWFSGNSKHGFPEMSNVKTLPLNLAVPQFHPLMHRSRSSHFMLNDEEKNFVNFSLAWKKVEEKQA